MRLGRFMHGTPHGIWPTVSRSHIPMTESFYPAPKQEGDHKTSGIGRKGGQVVCLLQVCGMFMPHDNYR
jgi:hypothetical protein